ncbi:MAG: hypothetical protein SV375_05180 [Thermodesulfobacteriota bacterium]|nr:hypothetical protein [Thermodesulfobacteriota bacterium]
MNEWKWYVDELMSEQCLCERPKKRHHSFCYRCYRSLPGDLQRALYNRIGDGYEEAFEEAVKWLEENVW